MCKIQILYLDIDIPFEKFPGSDEYKNLIEVCNRQKTISRMYRMSSGGNTHVRISLTHQVAVLRYFQLRAAMGDDPQHLACDLVRTLRFGDDTARQNLTADKKIKQGRLMSAGEWEPLK
jgi:hypothetical protein